MKKVFGFLALPLCVYFVSCTATKSVIQKTVDSSGVEYTLLGNGSPTLVFETGMGPSIETWDKILDSLSKHTKVYAYNRPGYGKSSLENPPLSVSDVARSLHDNLVQQNIEPPYVLVGHSAGGLYVNMFARLYPDETIGAVFIDASHPQQFEYFRTDQKFLYNMLIMSTRKGTRKYEYDIVTTALDEFKNVPEFPNIPIAVLTAGKSSPIENKELRKKWLEFQEELSSLSDNSSHQVVAGSGHYIHRNEPNRVIDEILRIAGKL
ncbi:alpha/beta fold hydrolase [Flagellimonas sp. 2504JD1-5]